MEGSCFIHIIKIKCLYWRHTMKKTTIYYILDIIIGLGFILSAITGII
jgi:hypothetical protein